MRIKLIRSTCELICILCPDPSVENEKKILLDRTKRSCKKSIFIDCFVEGKKFLLHSKKKYNVRKDTILDCINMNNQTKLAG